MNGNAHLYLWIKVVQRLGDVQVWVWETKPCVRYLAILEPFTHMPLGHQIMMFLNPLPQFPKINPYVHETEMENGKHM